LPDFTKKQLEVIVAALALDKGLDLLTGGWVNKQTKKVLLATAKRLAAPVGRASASVAGAVGRSAIGAAAPLVTNPYIAGAALGVGALQTPQGEALLDWAEEKGRRDRVAFEQYKTDVGMRMREFIDDPIGYTQELREQRPKRPSIIPGVPAITGKLMPGDPLLDFVKPKRKKSKYNRAVSAAMKAVKASTKGGKKGVISRPKTVFKTVSKAVSKVNKGAKVSTKGITGIAARAARKVLGKKKKTTKKTKGYSIRVN
jgi:hypothetical protein